MSRRMAIMVLALLGAGSLVSCSDEKKIEVNTGLAARIENIKLTRKELEDRIEGLPPEMANRYGGKEGKADFVDMIIDEEVLYLAALETDLKNEEEVREQLRRAEKNVLITAYYDKNIREKVEITDREVEQYYDEHPEEFLTRAIVKAQHAFTTDSMKAVEWKRRLDEGEEFNRIAKEESEDASTALYRGNLGYFNPGGYVKFYGESVEFADQIEHLAAGEISDVVVTEKGYSLVKINDKKPETLKPLSEVRRDIIDKLRSEKAQQALKARIAKLREKYEPVNFVRREILSTTRSPEELWAIAQEEDAPYTRILYYRELVERYPENRFAPQALFMIGFVYAEELQDLVEARRTFDELIDEYPDADVADSAEWMIENLEKPHPRFQSVDDMESMMKEDRGD